ncbi:MAG: bifunctional folylpolyglutamate synthase/dihydrofolate synthase, partial [Clostridia bacterium]|nr:bifunctional folylpolyglutamate synthase/dihydrofolate synthase [Clostridia bacterium]
MTFEHALKKISGFPRTNGKATTARMALLCRYLGYPEKKLKFIHIAGTNGKGSVASMTDEILRQAGYKV